ncbi:hypothetical protein BN14_10508 [Rhizoctonia solani AG-1 IB]|uniref:Uncharacterized protein n=1 Tax=Thanatephorus cucumeris (strain AG1-IB / isolate 7/3/14) TaxID=1108050 RepID=M5CAM0_THACB|nr:hypothetical protein BN14_10508 [Rhizoctonia solani AG-1 IB]
MPTAKLSSSMAHSSKACPRTSTNQASAASASSPKKQVFQIISAIRPSSSNKWEIVGENMSSLGTCPKRSWGTLTRHTGRRRRLGRTEDRRDGLKGVLKLPKPTGRSKMHPLHCLALAVNKDINKANTTYLLGDSINHNPYGNLHAEFKRAKRNMTHLKLDFKRTPNFNVLLRDEDVQVDGNKGDLSGNVEDDGSVADPGLSAKEGAIADKDSCEDAREDTGVDAREDTGVDAGEGAREDAREDTVGDAGDDTNCLDRTTFLIT